MRSLPSRLCPCPVVCAAILEQTTATPVCSRISDAGDWAFENPNWRQVAFIRVVETSISPLGTRLPSPNVNKPKGLNSVFTDRNFIVSDVSKAMSNTLRELIRTIWSLFQDIFPSGPRQDIQHPADNQGLVGVQQTDIQEETWDLWESDIMYSEIWQDPRPKQSWTRRPPPDCAAISSTCICVSYIQNRTSSGRCGQWPGRQGWGGDLMC